MKKFLNLKSILCCVAVVFGLIAALMLFVPALKIEAFGESHTIKGSVIAFGDKDEGFAVSAYILPLVLALVGVVLSVVALLGKGGKVVPVVAAVCFLGAAICFFLPKTFATPDLSEFEGAEKDYMKEIFKVGIKQYDLGAGAIVGGVFGIVAALASAAAVVCPIFLKSNSAE